MSRKPAKKDTTKTIVASSPAARNRMQATRRTNTKPELALQSLLHERGMSFQVDQSVIPKLRRRADILFAKEMVVVFVDGCFWHGCPIHGTWPKANAEFWRTKIENNRQRDIDTDTRLTEAGWLVIRVWAHESPVDVANTVARIVKKRSQGKGW